ncbi:MAG: hypothetical protein ABSH08_07875 [Tepidisphaeraceae bacterium]|jgi:hypothetical protein
MDAVKPLNYAPKPPAARRVWRWVYVLIFAAGSVIAAVQWGSGLWRRAESIYWQQKCLRFLQPPSHVVFEMNRGNVLHDEICVPRIHFEGIDNSRTVISDGTIFLHEMRRPNGTRCLMSLTFSPMFPIGQIGFRIQYLEWDLSLWPRMSNWDYLTVATDRGSPLGHWKFLAGQPDANNLSHFTFDYELDGLRHTCDAWLDNDGKLIVSQRP